MHSCIQRTHSGTQISPAWCTLQSLKFLICELAQHSRTCVCMERDIYYSWRIFSYLLIPKEMYTWTHLHTYESMHKDSHELLSSPYPWGASPQALSVVPEQRKEGRIWNQCVYIILITMSTKQRMQAVRELECTHYYMSIYRRDGDKMTDETCANFYEMSQPSLSLLSKGERRGTPWTGWQSIQSKNRHNIYYSWACTWWQWAD